MKRDIFSGIALGLLVGVLIGLSIAQVTGIILGALTSLLAAFFGLRPDKEGETGNKVIIAYFSISCFLAIFGGIFMRTHDLLAPSLEHEIAQYKKANFTDSEIKEILYVKKFGLLTNPNLSFNKDAATLNASKSTLLMADESQLTLCVTIDESSTLQELKEAYYASGGKFQRLYVQMMANADTVALKAALVDLKEILCE